MVMIGCKAIMGTTVVLLLLALALLLDSEPQHTTRWIAHRVSTSFFRYGSFGIRDIQWIFESGHEQSESQIPDTSTCEKSGRLSHFECRRCSRRYVHDLRISSFPMIRPVLLLLLSQLVATDAFVVLNPIALSKPYNNNFPNLPRQSQSLRSQQQQLSMMGLGEAWAAYNTALEENPLLVKSITASVILGAADLTGQFVETQIKNNFYTNLGEAAESSNNVVDDISLTGAREDESSLVAATTTTTAATTSVDWARVGRFALFGLVLQAPWNHFYYLLLDGVLPPTPDPWTATTAIKVVIDQFVQAPIFTVIIFAFLGTLEGKTFEAIQKQLQADYTDTMFANCTLCCTRFPRRVLRFRHRHRLTFTLLLQGNCGYLRR